MKAIVDELPSTSPGLVQIKDENATKEISVPPKPPTPTQTFWTSSASQTVSVSSYPPSTETTWSSCAKLPIHSQTLKRSRSDSDGTPTEALSALCSMKSLVPSKNYTSVFAAESNVKKITSAGKNLEDKSTMIPLQRIVRSVSEPSSIVNKKKSNHHVTTKNSAATSKKLFKFPTDFAAGRALRQKVLLPLLPNADATDARVLGMFFRGEVVVLLSPSNNPRSVPVAKMAKITRVWPSDVRSVLSWYECGDVMLPHTTEDWHKDWMRYIISPDQGCEMLKITVVHEAEDEEFGAQEDFDSEEIVGLIYYERNVPYRTNINGDNESLRATMINDIRIHPEYNIEVLERMRSYHDCNTRHRVISRVQNKRRLHYDNIVTSLVASVIMRSLLCETVAVGFTCPKISNLEECFGQIMGKYKRISKSGNKFFVLERNNRWDIVRKQFSIVYHCFVGVRKPSSPRVPPTTPPVPVLPLPPMIPTVTEVPAVPLPHHSAYAKNYEGNHGIPNGKNPQTLTASRGGWINKVNCEIIETLSQPPHPPRVSRTHAIPNSDVVHNMTNMIHLLPQEGKEKNNTSSGGGNHEVNVSAVRMKEKTSEGSVAVGFQPLDQGVHPPAHCDDKNRSHDTNMKSENIVTEGDIVPDEDSISHHDRGFSVSSQDTGQAANVNAGTIITVPVSTTRGRAKSDTSQIDDSENPKKKVSRVA
mmetsp:Transcript_10264/g.22788  ORF Transcript_10264/g.22788 Transcript_10264/m.22788 type:complete len:701 (-) Transcript_10264:75-2177(-)